MASVEATVTALKAFVPADDGKDVARLYETFEGFDKLSGRERAIPFIFELLERFPDADFGAPGPLVHELEAMDGYQLFLRESLRRQPTAVAVSMVNAILNSPLGDEDRHSWMDELRAAENHPGAPASAREWAGYYVEYQKRRRRAV